MTIAGSTLSSPLRAYQAEVRRAVLESIGGHHGRSFSVMVSRQGGKNELSAQIELELLLAYRKHDVTSIKAAPTFRPQALISLERLWDRICEAGIDAFARRENGNAVRLGRARQLFLSADSASNIVGHTASLLLEVDEAQDVDIEKFDKELQPMAAAHGATTVFYGTAWDDANPLERAKQAHLELERRDGIKRHFEYDWQVVARDNRDYRSHVDSVVAQLGPDHPVFLSQYCLRTLPGAGRLFGPTQLALLQGAHPALDSPLAGETYVAGLDVAGEAADRRSEAGHDATVLTIARVLQPETEGQTAATVEVVRHQAWTGAAHGVLQKAVVAVLREWRVRRVAVDATGIGEPLASGLAGALGPATVQHIKFTAESKSRLGYALLAAVGAGRLRMYAGSSLEALQCWQQLQLCRAAYRPNQTLAFYVDESEGHDDYVMSLALTIEAASDAGPRRARGRVAAD